MENTDSVLEENFKELKEAEFIDDSQKVGQPKKPRPESSSEFAAKQEKDPPASIHESKNSAEMNADNNAEPQKTKKAKKVKESQDKVKLTQDAEKGSGSKARPVFNSGGLPVYDSSPEVENEDLVKMNKSQEKLEKILTSCDNRNPIEKGEFKRKETWYSSGG